MMFQHFFISLIVPSLSLQFDVSWIGLHPAFATPPAYLPWNEPFLCLPSPLQSYFLKGCLYFQAIKPVFLSAGWGGVRYSRARSQFIFVFRHFIARQKGFVVSGGDKYCWAYDLPQVWLHLPQDSQAWLHLVAHFQLCCSWGDAAHRFIPFICLSVTPKLTHFHFHFCFYFPKPYSFIL